MKITLKNIKHADFASQETECYSASLYVDGKKIGDVSNDGCGGCDMFRGDNEAYRAANEWCKANLPKWEMNGKQFETDIEMHCSNILSEWLTSKELKQLLNGKVLTLRDGFVYETKFRGVSKVTQAHIDHVRKGNPDATILNEMPFEDALKAFIAATQS